MRPQIPYFGLHMLWIADFTPLHTYFAGSFSAVKEYYCAATVRERPAPNFQVSLLSDARSLLPQRVLINRDHFLIDKDVADFRLHVPHIIPGNQRRCMHSPQTKMRLILSD